VPPGGGPARFMAWLMLAARDPLDTRAAGARWRAISAAAHAARPRGASREDTSFVVVLAALATFGQAVAGPAVFEMAGLGADASAHFGPWLAELLGGRLTRVSPSPRARAAPAKEDAASRAHRRRGCSDPKV